MEQFELIESHLKEIEKVMVQISNRQTHFLTTITGISDVTACVVLGEIGSISRFERPEQLVAFAGLDASVHQSGDFNSNRTRLSKRGHLILDAPFGKLLLSQVSMTLQFFAL